MKRPVIKIAYNRNRDKGSRWVISKREERISNKKIMFELTSWTMVIGITIWLIVK